MINTRYYKAAIIILCISVVFTAFKDYSFYLKIREEDKTLACFQNRAENEKGISSSDMLKKLMAYEGMDIIKLESLRKEQNIITAQVEYKGEAEKAMDIFNEISKDAGIKSIKNINISRENEKTKIKADIDYLSNIICK